LTARIRTPKGQRPKRTPRPHLPVFSRVGPVMDWTTHAVIEPSPMNKGETLYAQGLDYHRLEGRILWWGFQALKLRLGGGAWYTPDFTVITREGAIECHEYKGHWEEAARVRIKVAASLYPWIKFVVVKGSRNGHTKEVVKAHHAMLGGAEET